MNRVQKDYSNMISDIIDIAYEAGNIPEYIALKEALELFQSRFLDDGTPVRPPPNPSNRKGTPAKELTSVDCG
jgi:hypothetical protein